MTEGRSWLILRLVSTIPSSLDRLDSSLSSVSLFLKRVLPAAAGLAGLVLSFVSTVSSMPPPAGPGDYRGWAGYGGGPEQMRYSSLTQINRSNVARLEVAWSYDTGETGGLQTQPIVVDGILYGYTPTQKTFALRAATGEHLWTFDPKIVGRGPNRGLMYWASGDDRRLFAAVDAYVYALNATTGEPIQTFGEGGRIDLRQDLGRDPEKQTIRLTSPGVVYKDLFIVGGRESEGLPGSPGDIRAYDVRSGKLRWAFHTIPHPGEPGYETWAKDSWTINGGANNWTGMALDEARGIVYVPTGSASADFYGANRPGDNLYANCLIALKADTGERIWHFQGVRHDIWDRDFPSPPTLARLQRDGRTIDAVLQTSKQGFVFAFDRSNGTPLFPIEYRHFPKSDLPGETTNDTQPIPTMPKPFARQLLTRDMLTTRHARSAPVGGRSVRHVSQRRSVRPAHGGPRYGRLSRLRRRRRVGRLRVRSGDRPAVRERERPPVDRRDGREHGSRGRPDALPAELRGVPPR